MIKISEKIKNKIKESSNIPFFKKGNLLIDNQKLVNLFNNYL